MKVAAPEDSPRSKTEVWPSLPVAEWQASYATLHMWLQIVGKTRLALAPRESHWWHVALYLTPRGLTTSAMPFRNVSVSVDFDFIDHVLVIATSDGGVRRIPLVSMSVADFFAQYQLAMASLEITLQLVESPVEVETSIPFTEDRLHHQYDPVAVNKCWRILLATDRVLKRFRGRFLGKQSPSHFFWGSFDLAATRFSGNSAPPHPGGAPNCPDEVMVEAYSHECASCGFWPGGGASAEPAFYAYTYPRPAGYELTKIRPAAAFWDEKAGEFLLPYEAIRSAVDPEADLLDFFQSAYEGAADRESWPRDVLDRPVESWP